MRAEGLTKSIGLSNFREEEIKALAPHWTIPPAINQVGGLARCGKAR